jgi:hypothetical protein
MRLLNLTMPQIQEVVEGLEKESKALKKELYKFSWYMRGGLSFTEALMLDYQDRVILSEIVKENLETAKETNMPFF